MSFLAAVVGCMLNVGCVTMQAPDGPVATESECKAIVARAESMVKESLAGADFFAMSCIELPAGFDTSDTRAMRELVLKAIGPKKGLPV